MAMSLDAETAAARLVLDAEAGLVAAFQGGEESPTLAVQLRAVREVLRVTHPAALEAAKVPPDPPITTDQPES